MIKININYSDVYVTRDGKKLNVTCGDKITQEEFATIVSESMVLCVDEDTGTQYTFTPGKPVVYATAPELVVETTEIPATDAGRVPTPVAAGSKSTKA